MNITNLQLKNFKGKNMICDPFKKINIFVGPNGAGKTSALEGIRYLITGDDPRECDVKTAAQSGEVSGTVDNIFVSRSFGTKNAVKVEGKISTQKAFREMLTTRTGVDPEMLKVITLGNLVTSMDSGEFSTFLVNSGLVPLDMDIDKLISISKLTNEAEAELRDYCPKAPLSFGADFIQDTYKMYFAKRTETKKMYDTEKKKSIWEDPIPAGNLTALDQEIGKLTAGAEQMKVYRRDLDAYNNSVAAREAHIKKMQEAEKIYTAGNKIPQPSASAKQALESELERTVTDINEKKSTLKVLDSNIDMFRNTLANLATDKCPISAKLICSTDKTQVRSEITALLEENEKQKKTLVCAVETAEKKVVILKEKKAAIEKAASDYADVKAAYERYKLLKETLPAVPVAPVKPSVDDISAKLAEIENAKKVFYSYQAACEAKKNAEILSERIKVYDKIVKALQPKGGAIDMITECAFVPLIKYCNSKAAMIDPDLSVAVRINGGVHFMLIHKNIPVDIKDASSGEQLIIAMLIVDMLNSLSGANVLLLDDLDKLDGDRMNALLHFLTTNNSYDNVFLAAVDHKDTIDLLSHYPDIEVFRV